MNLKIFAPSITAFTLILGAAALQAQAGKPETHSLLSRETKVLRELNQLSDQELNRVFDLKDHKGESIFKRKSREQANQWATLDPTLDLAEGTSTEKIYRDFHIPKRKNEVVVAVIDSGVDIKHEDLKGHVWVNFAEFYGKPGVDDDGDGYIDDIFGWNFLGNKDGSNVGSTNLEVTRLYAKLKAKSEVGTLSQEESALYDQVSKEVTEGIDSAKAGLTRYEAFDAAIKLLKSKGLVEESLEGLAAVTANDPETLKAKQLATIIYKRKKTSADITKGLAYFHSELDYHYNVSFDSSAIIGDHADVMDEVGYGNNDVTGPDALHGTHVAGIIAGVRDNRYGIKGQGRNIKIMSLRAVPDGDERDKDIANAIRFAVDHGAQVINMSFGKPYSPNKANVDQAMKYAEAAGVLLVHAAGNDSLNTESQGNNFPNRTVVASLGKTRQIETWIEVGASSKEKGINLPADFSNYGKTSVDVFAPGKDIVSTLPNNEYGALSGTSMASPEVAGVAALLLEKFPNASALEVKDAILTTVNHYGELACALPGTASEEKPTIVNFDSLSATGGTVNAYEAFLKLRSL